VGLQMAKYTWIEIETEEEFIETFGENPRWILSSAPTAAKSNTLKGDDNVSKRNGKGRSKRGADNKTIS
tara:strand:+ start:527 stop:733 length:207 start_codon:yes stop_codon:yes gene_type:complete